MADGCSQVPNKRAANLNKILNFKPLTRLFRIKNSTQKHVCRYNLSLLPIYYLNVYSVYTLIRYFRIRKENNL